MELTAAVAEGRLIGLRALRDQLAREIQEGPQARNGPAAVSQTAALARQLRDVLKDIEELEKAIPHGSVVDDVAERRRKRLGIPSGAGEAVGSDGL